MIYNNLNESPTTFLKDPNTNRNLSDLDQILATLDLHYHQISRFHLNNLTDQLVQNYIATTDFKAHIEKHLKKKNLFLIKFLKRFYWTDKLVN